MTEQKQEGYRLMHHSRRIPLCADSKSAGPYFTAIKEDFTILYPEQTPKDLYRYELQYYQDTFTEWAEEKRETISNPDIRDGSRPHGRSTKIHRGARRS